MGLSAAVLPSMRRWSETITDLVATSNRSYFFMRTRLEIGRITDIPSAETFARRVRACKGRNGSTRRCSNSPFPRRQNPNLHVVRNFVHVRQHVRFGVVRVSMRVRNSRRQQGPSPRRIPPPNGHPKIDRQNVTHEIQANRWVLCPTQHGSDEMRPPRPPLR